MNKTLVKTAAPSQTTDMLALAVEKGASVDTIERLIEMRERVDRNDARKAFNTAMAEAKANLPVIVKNQEVDFSSQKGRTRYKYEDFAGLAKQVDPILAPLGLSYRYRSSSNDKTVTVTCVISHRDGHFEENTLTGPLDHSGNKNPIQAIGSAVTYLQRYTLKLALGLSASADDDAQAVSDKVAEPKPRYREPESGPQPTKRTPEQVVAEQRVQARHLADAKIQTPHKLSVPQLANRAGPDFRKFAQDLVDAMRACPEMSDVFLWQQENQSTIDEMQKHVPMMHKNLVKAIEDITSAAT